MGQDDSQLVVEASARLSSRKSDARRPFDADDRLMLDDLIQSLLRTLTAISVLILGDARLAHADEQPRCAHGSVNEPRVRLPPRCTGLRLSLRGLGTCR
ncbi:hypothetical protein ADK51_29535 [Streptomyces sp. WM6368]|nr:hypothetical protein ADK51_29535 [Streptomyces sp. WM6368]